MSFELRYSGHLFHYLVQLERIKMHSVALEHGFRRVSDTLNRVGSLHVEKTSFSTSTRTICAVAVKIRVRESIIIESQACCIPHLASSGSFRKNAVIPSLFCFALL